MSRPAAPGSCRVCSRGSRGSRKGPCRRADRTARDPCYGGFPAGSQIFGFCFFVSTQIPPRLFFWGAVPYIFSPFFFFFFFCAAPFFPPARVQLFFFFYSSS